MRVGQAAGREVVARERHYEADHAEPRRRQSRDQRSNSWIDTARQPLSEMLERGAPTPGPGRGASGRGRPSARSVLLVLHAITRNSRHVSGTPSRVLCRSSDLGFEDADEVIDVAVEASDEATASKQGRTGIRSALRRVGVSAWNLRLANGRTSVAPPRPTCEEAAERRPSSTSIEASSRGPLVLGRWDSR
jgi:hypothetical protein